MLLLALAAGLAPARLPPIDQCARDPSFVEFRTELRRTIARRDARALLSVVVDDVHASLGGDNGKKDFIELWGLKRPLSSRLWAELDQALRLGCSLKGGIATAPSFEHQLSEARDPFETLIALPGAVLRSTPGDTSAAVATLDWDVLTVRGPWNGGEWVPVRLDDGRWGFVRRSLARSPIDYRVWFDKSAGRWLLRGFLAGD